MNTQLVTKMLNDGVKINLSVSHMLNINHIVYAAVSWNAISFFFFLKHKTDFILLVYS